MQDSAPASSGASSSEAAEADAAANGGVDVRALADMVYRLMLADIRIEAARGARPRTPHVRRWED